MRSFSRRFRRSSSRKPLPARGRTLKCEMLEDRRMLSVSGGSEAGASETLQLFSTSTAQFVENLGQWSDETVRYGFQGNGVNIAFSDEGLAFSLSQQEDGDANSTQFAVGFDGANETTPVGLAETESRFNYFVGDQSSHRSGVAAYATVAYQNLYDGIDLHTFGRRDSLKYEFYVSPGSDYQQISVSFDNTDGLWIDDDGALHVGTPLGELVEEAPYIFQVVDGQEVEVTGAFVLVDDDTYSFDITGEYDPTVELVIDPDLAWGSYLGGSYYDSAEDVAVDSSGNVHVTGATQSSEWVSGGWFTDYDSPTYAYVVKLSSDGQHLWSTYVGGGAEDHGESIALDASGNVFVTGTTDSEDWVSGGWDTNIGHGDEETADGFVVKLSSSGDHLWSTYIGGAADGVDGGYDYGNAITVDSQGNALVTGTTDSQGWISGGADTSHNGGSDAYVVKLSGSGSHLWSTYLGGNIGEKGLGIAVDASDNVLVTGSTRSSGWISGDDYNGNYDAFVSKLSSSGSHLWSTYLGGSDDDFGKDIATDAGGNIFVTGDTRSSGWISGGWDTSLSGSKDGFVQKLSSDGDPVWSTYLGGNNNELANGIAVDGSGNVVVTGATWSAGWVSGGWDTSRTGGGYVVTLSESGDHVWSSYLESVGEGVAADGSGNGFVVGRASSSPSGLISGGWQETPSGGFRDGFVAKFSISDSLPGDLATWQNSYGMMTGGQSEDGDADSDGDVDGFDFLAWQRGSSSVSTVATSSSVSANSAATVASVASEETVVPEETAPAEAFDLTTEPVSAFSLLSGVSGVRESVRGNYRPALRAAAVEQAWIAFDAADVRTESGLKGIAEDRLHVELTEQQHELTGVDEDLQDSVLEGLVFGELL